VKSRGCAIGVRRVIIVRSVMLSAASTRGIAHGACNAAMPQSRVTCSRNGPRRRPFPPPRRSTGTRHPGPADPDPADTARVGAIRASRDVAAVDGPGCGPTSCRPACTGSASCGCAGCSPGSAAPDTATRASLLIAAGAPAVASRPAGPMANRQTPATPRLPGDGGGKSGDPGTTATTSVPARSSATAPMPPRAEREGPSENRSTPTGVGRRNQVAGGGQTELTMFHRSPDTPEQELRASAAAG